MAGNDAITFLFLAMILQQGANYWADDGVHVNFQTDAAKKAWQDEIDSSPSTTSMTKRRYTERSASGFFQGKAAMSMVGPWAIAGGPDAVPGSGVRVRQPADLRGHREQLCRRVGLG